jgi:hypothetical protein
LDTLTPAILILIKVLVMSDKVQPNPNEASTHDAQLTAEQIASGEKKHQM